MRTNGFIFCCYPKVIIVKVKNIEIPSNQAKGTIKRQDNYLK